MLRTWKSFALGGLLLTAACAGGEVYGVFGDDGDVFTGQLSSVSGQGHIEVDNGKGTSCVGDYVSRRPAPGTGLIGIAIAVSRPATIRSLMSCSDGRRAAVQLTSLSLTSGYGFGTTDLGQPVRITYGLTRDQATQYLKVQPAAASPGSGDGTAASSQTRIATGTGFFVTQQGHILTNAHVIDRCKSLMVARTGEVPATVSVVNSDKQNDLAVLMAASPPPAIAALRTGRPVRQGEPVIAFGFPYAGSLSSGGSVTTGSISALSGLRDDTRYLQISAPVQPGNSGGPLLDSTGAVIGVVSSGLRAANPTAAQPQNVNFAVKADVVRTFLAAIGVNPEAAAATRELSTPDIGERARAFTVLIDCKG